MGDGFGFTVRKVYAGTFVLNVLRIDAAGAWSQDLGAGWLAWE